MLSYENPARDFQGITYETPCYWKSFKAAGEIISSGGFEKRLGTGKTVITYADSAWKSGYDSVRCRFSSGTLAYCGDGQP